MNTAKDIRVAPISSADAKKLVKRYHYSGTVVNNSQLHLGVFLEARCLGAMSFGPPLDKRKLLPLVADTPWNGFVELNRMALSDELPRNSESRSLAIAMRILKKQAPHVQWVVTFADAAQCGDGTIYRAAGFLLTGIKRNTQVWSMPGAAGSAKVFSRVTATKGGHITNTGTASMRQFIEAGAVALPGYQLRYIYFLDPSARSRLTVPVLPYSKIAEVGACMYRGKSTERAESIAAMRLPNQVEEGGSTPTSALQPDTQ